MPDVNLYHAAIEIYSGGDVGDAVRYNGRNYRPQTSESDVDRWMEDVPTGTWKSGGNHYICDLADQLAKQVQEAITRVPDRNDTLLVFTAPEFFFKDSPQMRDRVKMYGAPFSRQAFYEGAERLKRQLGGLVERRQLGQRHVVVCAGTMWWSEPGAAGGHDVWTIHNSSPFWSSTQPGQLTHLEKKTASHIDGVHIDAGDVWDRDNPDVAAAWDRVGPQPQLSVTLGNGARLTLAVEICLDWIKGRLRSAGVIADVHVVVACGAPLAADTTRNIVARNGGAFLRNDGGGGAVRTDTATMAAGTLRATTVASTWRLPVKPSPRNPAPPDRRVVLYHPLIIR